MEQTGKKKKRSAEKPAEQRDKPRKRLDAALPPRRRNKPAQAPEGAADAAKKQSVRFTPRLVTRLFIGGTAGVLLLLLVAMAATRYLKRDAAEPAAEPVTLVEFRPVPVFEASFDTLPDPTPTPIAVPLGAVDVCIGGVPVMALYSKQEAEQVLTAYLDMSAKAPEGEHFLSASYESEILFSAASGAAPLFSVNEALKLLLSEPALVPVTVRTQKRTVDTGSAQVSVQQEASLAKGARFIVQLGTGARTATVTERVYIGGQMASTGEPVSEVLTAARTTLLKTGAYRAKDPDGEPDDSEGKKGKDAGDLSFVKPMQGAYSSYFGTRRGSMHNGVDIAAKAGTAITAPAEGVVIYCAERGDYGLTIDIDHGSGFVSRLTHCADVSLMLHQRVFKGDRLATLSGDADEPHLHYELIADGIPVNPLYYLPKK